jgi:hypothetical protein
MNVVLKYSLTDTEPTSGNNYLELDCIYDDRKITPVQEETVLADKTIFPEREGHRKSLTLFLYPEQVEDNLEFFRNMLGAQNIWVYTPTGKFKDGTSSLLCSIEDRDYALKFLDLVETPLTFKSCKIFPSIEVTGWGEERAVDSYDESHCDSNYDFTGAGGAPRRAGQSFRGDGSVLKSCEFYIKRSGMGWLGGHFPPDPYPPYCYAHLYLDSGAAFGTDSCPATDAVPLDVSDARLVYPGMMDSFRREKFVFHNDIILEVGVKYVIVFAFSLNGILYNTLSVELGKDGSSPSHPGNACKNASDSGDPWVAESANDLIFYVNGIKGTPLPTEKIKVILKYAPDGTEPEKGDEGFLELDCHYDDRTDEPTQTETELAGKTIYPERDGRHKKLTIYLDPEQVENNFDFLVNLLGAQSIWMITPDGDFQDDGDALLCSIEDREYDLQFLSLADSPLTFKSCKVFPSVVPT